MQTSAALELRLFFFITVFLVFALAETCWPRRSRTQRRVNRWSTNLSLAALGALSVRLLAFTGVFGLAYANIGHLGLFYSFKLPHWLAVLLSVLVLDGAIYFQHRIFHRIPFLWRIHSVHHADLDLDVTSGVRFHPAEILISYVFKIFIVLMFGVPPFAFVLFEIILNATAMFNHANWSLGLKTDKVFRRVLVTPDMHRVHHSTNSHEFNRNFGFNLSLWDRLFKTYQAQPIKGHLGMSLGLNKYPSPAQASKLGALLSLPFTRD